MPDTRLTVALTFDGDSVSDAVRRGDPPVKLSHGEFGARIGIPRILDLLEREAIRATSYRALAPRTLELVEGGESPATSLARASTWTSIGFVRTPVKVFCWLGW